MTRENETHETAWTKPPFVEDTIGQEAAEQLRRIEFIAYRPESLAKRRAVELSIFEVDRRGLRCAIECARLSPLSDEMKPVRATLLPDTLLLNNSLNGVSCTVRLPLLTSSGVPTNGLSFQIPVRYLRGISAKHNDESIARCELNVATKTLSARLRDARGRYKLLFVNLTIELETPGQILQMVADEQAQTFDPRALKNALIYTRVVTARPGVDSSVEVADGRVVAWTREGLVMVTDVGFEKLKLRIASRDVVTVCRLLGRLNRKDVNLREGDQCYTIRDELLSFTVAKQAPNGYNLERIFAANSRDNFSLGPRVLGLKVMIFAALDPRVTVQHALQLSRTASEPEKLAVFASTSNGMMRGQLDLIDRHELQQDWQRSVPLAMMLRLMWLTETIDFSVLDRALKISSKVHEANFQAIIPFCAD